MLAVNLDTSAERFHQTKFIIGTVWMVQHHGLAPIIEHHCVLIIIDHHLNCNVLKFGRILNPARRLVHRYEQAVFLAGYGGIALVISFFRPDPFLVD